MWHLTGDGFVVASYTTEEKARTALALAQRVWLGRLYAPVWEVVADEDICDLSLVL